MSNSEARLEAMLDASYAALLDDSAAERARAMFDALVADLDAPIRWRPVAEAPKDGTKVLLLLFDGEVVTAKWRETGSGMPWVNSKRGLCWGPFTPTHFAELKGPDHG